MKQIIAIALPNGVSAVLSSPQESPTHRMLHGACEVTSRGDIAGFRLERAGKRGRGIELANEPQLEL